MSPNRELLQKSASLFQQPPPEQSRMFKTPFQFNYFIYCLWSKVWIEKATIHATDERIFNHQHWGERKKRGKKSQYNVMDLKIPWEFHIQGPNTSVRDSKVNCYYGKCYPNLRRAIVNNQYNSDHLPSPSIKNSNSNSIKVCFQRSLGVALTKQYCSRKHTDKNIRIICKILYVPRQGLKQKASNLLGWWDCRESIIITYRYHYKTIPRKFHYHYITRSRKVF